MKLKANAVSNISSGLDKLNIRYYSEGLLVNNNKFLHLIKNSILNSNFFQRFSWQLNFLTKKAEFITYWQIMKTNTIFQSIENFHES